MKKILLLAIVCVFSQKLPLLAATAPKEAIQEAGKQDPKAEKSSYKRSTIIKYIGGYIILSYLTVGIMLIKSHFALESYVHRMGGITGRMRSSWGLSLLGDAGDIITLPRKILKESIWYMDLRNALFLSPLTLPGLLLTSSKGEQDPTSTLFTDFLDKYGDTIAPEIKPIIPFIRTALEG